MNLQAKLLINMDKPSNVTIQQQQQQQQQLKANPLMGNQGTFDMLQTMMNNLNMNAQNPNLGLANYNNSPSKLILSQLNSAVPISSSNIQSTLSSIILFYVGLNWLFRLLIGFFFERT